MMAHASEPLFLSNCMDCPVLLRFYVALHTQESASVCLFNRLCDCEIVHASCTLHVWLLICLRFLSFQRILSISHILCINLLY